MSSDEHFMRLALRLARRGYGTASPNPMVGAVLVKRGRIIGRGWHRCAGGPHAEIEALSDARLKGHDPKGATLYVTLEPCCTHGRTPPCTTAIRAADIKRVVAGAIDPNPLHRGRGLAVLRRAGVEVTHGPLAAECEDLNDAFNHWIVHRTPLVTVKAAMTLDGKIATASGQSKWITSEPARAGGMWLRQGADAIVVGINTVLADNPSLTLRNSIPGVQPPARSSRDVAKSTPRRIVLDARARTPLSAAVVRDDARALTTIVVSRAAARSRVAALSRRVDVLRAPVRRGLIDLRWLLKRLGSENVTSLLVEGGGEVNGSFLLAGLVHRVAFFYAPRILGGRTSRRAVGGEGAHRLADAVKLEGVAWRRIGPDFLLTARVKGPVSGK